MIHSSPIRAILFDMDGVLTDSEPLICSAAMTMFKELGVEVKAEDFSPFVGTGEDRYLGGVAALYGVPIDLPSAKHRTYQIYLDLVPTCLRAFAGACELVRLCHRNHLKLAVASSADLIKVAANLNKIGLPPSFWGAILTAGDVTLRKPAPDIFLTAAQRLDVSPESCVVVEDAIHGVLAAKAARMRCVAVAHTFPQKTLALADIVRPTIADVSLDDLLFCGRPPCA